MWFLLRMAFWLGVALILLASVAPRPEPKSQINAVEAVLAAKDIVTDIRHICERQREACAVGSQTSVTLGERARAGAKMLYAFLSEHLASERRGAPMTASAPASPRASMQDTLQPTDRAPAWRAPHRSMSYPVSQ